MEENKGITLDINKLKVVDINTIRPNTWNPKEKDTKEYQQVFTSVKVNGQMESIKVRQNTLGESLYEILDGEQKWRACIELGYDKVMIYDYGEVDDKRAIELTLWYEAHVSMKKALEAKLVTNAIQKFPDLQTFYTEKTIDNFKKIAEAAAENVSNAPQMPPPPTVELLKNFMVQVTTSQYDVIEQALEKAKRAAAQEGTEITNSKALEFVCAEYLTTPEPTAQDTQNEAENTEEASTE